MTSDLVGYVEQAKESLYFSGAKIDTHVSTFLDEQGEVCKDLGGNLASGMDRLYLVASGGSFASLATAKYILDRHVAVPSEALLSYEFVWRTPRLLDGRSVVVLASQSGETEDTVAALRFAHERGAKTVAIVGTAGSTMAREANFVIPYASGAIYEVPILALILFALGLASGTDQESELRVLSDELKSLPGLLRDVCAREEAQAETKARQLLRVQHLYVLGAGPLAALAYKVALTVVMENIRIGSTYCETSEWRHGPAEVLERSRPDLLVLLGTDESRDVSLRTIEFCRDQGTSLLIYDAAEFAGVHPLLTPLIVNSQTQWLVVYSAILRGITDLDARVFMGHNVLATAGARWP